MSFKNEDEAASFYKILLSDSEYLRLPSAFANKYLEKGDSKKQTMVLQTKASVKKWRVKYVRIEDSYYFMGGWVKFMNQNHLQIGDFLVFWLRSYNPNPLFHVFIYSPNGCLRDTNSGSDGHSCDGVLLERSLTLWRDFRKTWQIYQMPLGKCFVKATGISGYRNLRLENNKGKVWNASLRMRGGKHTPYIGGGWPEFWKDNKVKLGDRCAIDHVRDNLLRVRVFKKRGRPSTK